MNPTAIKATMNLVGELFPKLDWHSLIVAETTRRIGRYDLTAEQAKAAIVNLRMAQKWATIQPCEILAALSTASPARAHIGTAPAAPVPTRRLAGYVLYLARLADTDPKHPDLVRHIKRGRILFAITMGLRGVPQSEREVAEAGIPPGGWTPDDRTMNDGTIVADNPDWHP